MLLRGEFGQSLPVVCSVHRDEKFSAADDYFRWKTLVMLKVLQACWAGEPLLCDGGGVFFTPGFEVFSFFKHGNRFVERCSAELFAERYHGAGGLDTTPCLFGVLVAAHPWGRALWRGSREEWDAQWQGDMQGCV